MQRALRNTHVKWTYPVCRRRTARAAWRSQAQPQALKPVREAASMPTFRYRVPTKQAASKLRLDTFLAAQVSEELAAAAAAAEGPAAGVQDVSRAKIQASIASGLVTVNGRPAGKASQQLRPGDWVECALPPPPPLKAEPEAIPLDIRYEDEHLLVVNKPAGMVVHVAPGHYSGTMVNALLHHCALPGLILEPDGPGATPGVSPDGADASDLPDLDGDDCLGGHDHDDEDYDDEGGGGGISMFSTLRVLDTGLSPGLGPGSESGSAPVSEYGSAGGGVGSGNGRVGGGGGGAVLRPGIVHRLDKGTSGLLVVAKTETALTRLQAQFKARTVDRLYVSITVGCPPGAQGGRVEANIVRDPRDRKRMAAAPYGSGRGRSAASNYWVETPLAGGGAALVRWKLDTGRTHQIRVHAKHIGHPLLGDDTYGGSGTSAVAAVSRNYPADQVRSCLQQLGRPALHALTLAFDHPVTGRRLAFEQPPPADFTAAVRQLQG